MISYFSINLNFKIENYVNFNWQPPFKANNFFVKNYDTYGEWIEILDRKFVDEINSLLPISRLMLFNKPFPWISNNCHIDPDVLFALNLVKTQAASDQKSYMEWFRLKNRVDREPVYSKGNTPYIDYRPDEVELVHRECLDNLVSIVRTDIPHRIKVSAAPRTCFSLRFSPRVLIEKQLTTWQDVYEFFHQANLIK